MDGESSVAAQVAAQSADEQAAARASAKSPRKSLKHDLFYEEPISQLQADAAEKAGASPGLLKRARGALAKQQEGDGEAEKTSDAAPEPQNPLDLTSELADSGDGDVSATTPAPKKKVKVNPVLAQLRAPTATQSIVRADQLKKALKKEAEARQPAEEETKTTAAGQEEAAAQTQEARGQGEPAVSSASKKRKVGDQSAATKAKFASVDAINNWKRPRSEKGGGLGWMTWGGSYDQGMKCATCIADGKAGDAFTTEDGYTQERRSAGAVVQYMRLQCASRK